MTKRISNHPVTATTKSRAPHPRGIETQGLVGLSALLAQMGLPGGEPSALGPDLADGQDEPTGPVGSVAERTEAVHQRLNAMIESFQDLEGNEAKTIEALASTAFASYLYAQQQLNQSAAQIGFRLWEQGARVEGGPEKVIEVALGVTGNMTNLQLETYMRKELGVPASWTPATDQGVKTGT